MSLHTMWVSVVGTMGEKWMAAWGAVEMECMRWAKAWLEVVTSIDSALREMLCKALL